MSNWISWTNMLSWWQWTILGAVPPAIVLLYFLKLKRQPRVVPSTYLWKRSVEDLHVNSIWQKLRRNLLLFLQLLLVALAMLALLGPSWLDNRLIEDRLIFLIDNSASMNAADAEPTRLEKAKQQTGELIRKMRGDDVGMVIAFNDAAQVVQQFTGDRNELLRRLETIRPTARTTALDEALRVAGGLANPGRSADNANPDDRQIADAMPAALYIFSDGRFADVQGFSLGNLEPNYRPIGDEAANNTAVAAFETRRGDRLDDRLQAFARIEHFSTKPRTIDAALYLNDATEPIDVKRLELPPIDDEGRPGVVGVEFTLREFTEGVLRVQIDGEDALALDDRAWAVVNRPRRGKVLLVTPGNPWLELGLRTADAQLIAEVEVVGPAAAADETYLKPMSEGVYDLVIYDRAPPAVNDDPSDVLHKMPQANTLAFGVAPPVGWTFGETTGDPSVIDSDRIHPLTQGLELGGLRFYEANPVSPPPGATSLIDADVGTLFAIGPREGFEDAVAGFGFAIDRDGSVLVNTNWPTKVSFPLFIHNVLSYLGGGRQSLESLSVQPGRPIVLRADSTAETLQVRDPSGATTEVRRSATGGYVYSGADQLGVYELLEGDQPTQRFAVNLFSSAESDVRVRPEAEINIGYTKVAGVRREETTKIQGWKWLVLGALAVLLFEWYVYNRRVYL